MRSTLERGRAIAIWSAFRCGLIIALALGAVLPFQPTLADETTTPAFRDGHTDRQAWETWFDGLGGAYRAGAEFWASHRSDPSPPDCTSTSDDVFRAGCEEAKKRLNESDRRRHAEADYKAGWNSPLDMNTESTGPTVPTQIQASPPPSQSPEVVTPSAAQCDPPTVPNDDEIMSSLITLWSEQRDAANSKSINDLRERIPTLQNQEYGYGLFGCNSLECKRDVEKDIADTKAAIPEAISKLQRERGKGGLLYASGFVFAIVKNPPPTNYEGNVIAYINKRTKGTDNVSQEKITMKCTTDGWVVADEHEVQ